MFDSMGPSCHHYLLCGRTAVWQRDAVVDKALMGAFVLVEDLPHCQAVFKHLHLFLLLQRHFQPFLSLQDLLLQRCLQFLQESIFECLKLDEIVCFKKHKIMIFTLPLFALGQTMG